MRLQLEHLDDEQQMNAQVGLMPGSGDEVLLVCLAAEIFSFHKGLRLIVIQGRGAEMIDRKQTNIKSINQRLRVITSYMSYVFATSLNLTVISGKLQEILQMVEFVDNNLTGFGTENVF